MTRKEEAAKHWQQTLDYLYAQRPAYERQGSSGYKPGLDTSKALDNLYGNPHHKYRIVHVAGTNGKGSVSHLLADILHKSGYRVGLYTSPHLIDFRERIRVNGKEISRTYVMNWVSRFKRKGFTGNPSFFELTSTMAFDYFGHRRVNVAVVETGLGGRLDSTNIVTPQLSVITNIGLEHTEFLGSTLESIASEKAGIIKPFKPVVIGEASGNVRQVFELRAEHQQAPIVFAQDDPQVLNARHADGKLMLETQGYGMLESELTGDYQIANANTVLTALKVLKSIGFSVREQAVRESFAHVCEDTGLMGRWMKLNDAPLTICDSGHNVAGLTAVTQQLAQQTYDHLHIVIGFMADKDLAHILPLFPQRATYYFTQAPTPRSLPAQQLQAMASPLGLQGQCYDNVMQAYQAAQQAATASDMIFIGGSMYVLAELLSALQQG